MKIANLTLALGLTLFLAGCGDSGTGLEATDLEGTWTAAQMEYTDNANSGTVVDIIARDGATLTLTVDAA